LVEAVAFGAKYRVSGKGSRHGRFTFQAQSFLRRHGCRQTSVAFLRLRLTSARLGARGKSRLPLLLRSPSQGNSAEAFRLSHRRRSKIDVSAGERRQPEHSVVMRRSPCKPA